MTKKQNAAAIQVEYLLQVAGIEVRVKNQRYLDRLFKQVGGRVLEMGDKSLTMEFPSRQAADQFMREAKPFGAMFRVQ